MHVLGMPPAFVLSQDQTLKFVSHNQQHKDIKPSPTARYELREPIPALVKRNGYEGHIRHRLALNCVTEPEAPKTQAPSPTCPFI
ncbi:hypothetical protein SPHV1_1020006 [Novosphingobium sp. KN65.2]|nr:hypothetical protein SPHV1_1020006 [Novosphingobium sp. KN65.2]